MLVVLALLGQSLSHLASGVAIVTGSGERDGWLMAVGIDLSFVALELALLVAPAAARPAVARYAQSAIVGTLATSAAMNAFDFASHADGLMLFPAMLADGHGRQFTITHSTPPHSWHPKSRRGFWMQ